MLQLFYLLIAYTILHTLAVSRGLPIDQPDYPGVLFTLAGTAAVLVLVWVLGLLVIRLQLALAKRGSRAVLPGIEMVMLIAHLSAYYVILTTFGWCELLYQAGLVSVPVLSDMLALLPALLIAAAGIRARYPLDDLMRPGHWTPLSHFGFHFRMICMSLPVILVLVVAQELVQLVSHIEFVTQALWTIPTLQIVGELLPLVLALAVFPVLLRTVLVTRPLPDDGSTQRFRNLATHIGVRFRGLRLWDTGRAQMPNALVTGLTNGTRWVYLSDVIMNRFPADEQDAVFCHEMGHVKHHHLQLFMGTIIGFAVLFSSVGLPLMVQAGIGVGMASGDIQTLAMISQTMLVLGLLGFLLAYISPINERQADLVASRYGPHPLTIALVLERLNQFMGGNMRDHPSLTHGSIASRIDFIQTVSVDPAVATRFDQHAAFWHRLLAGFAFVGIASMALPLAGEWQQAGAQNEIYRILTEADETWNESGEHAAWWQVERQLAELSKTWPNDPRVAYERGRAAEKLAYFVLDPSLRLEAFSKARGFYQQSMALAGLTGFSPLYALEADEDLAVLLEDPSERLPQE